GKTIIRRAFTHRVQQENPEVILIQPARLDCRKITAESISSAICRALQIKHRPSAEERDAAVEEALIESANNGHLHLMIIDEAHDLSADVI
ncbi:ATP-binding protein, partial [Streptomyces brasiliscabiei]|uniref:ATP-binding protein n=1 Tax=Streptomyces brasiliscabiei TaxID=2736302 RepID=UPI0030153F53